MEVLQTSALPLGYAAVSPQLLTHVKLGGSILASFSVGDSWVFERMTGLEPATLTLAR